MKTGFVYGAILMTTFMQQHATARQYDLKSPNGRVQVEVVSDGSISYSISMDGQPLVTSGTFSLQLDNGSVPATAEPVNVVERSEDVEIKPAVAVKNAMIRDQYNEL